MLGLYTKLAKHHWVAVGLSILFSCPVSSFASQCPNTAQTISGTIYCDNQFILWVNGKRIAADPIPFTPHQAVNVNFQWDGKSDIQYAIQCEDYASASGYEYINSWRPQLGDGALIARFDDPLSTTTSSAWKVYTVTYGPTEQSIKQGCNASNLDKCEVENRGVPEGWQKLQFDDWNWLYASQFTPAQAGWGRKPTWSAEQGCCTLTSPLDRATIGCDKSVSQSACLDPRVVFDNSDAEFIWAEDLQYHNRVLFRYTASCQS